jgi:hypothetical protein
LNHEKRVPLSGDEKVRALDRPGKVKEVDILKDQAGFNLLFF